MMNYLRSKAFANLPICFLLISLGLAEPSERKIDVDLLFAAQAGSLQAVSAAIHAGANPNMTLRKPERLYNSEDLSPLMAACQSSRTDVVEYLLNNGARVDLQNSAGHTALMIASAKGDPQTVTVLLKFGAKPSIKDASARTAAEMAAERGWFSVVELLTHGSPPTRSLATASLIGAASQGDLTMLKKMIQMHADINAVSEGGDTALVAASRSCKADAVAALIKAGADIDLKDTVFGDKPIHWAAQRGCNNVIELFLHAGAPVDTRNSSTGATPLILAAGAGHVETAKLLLTSGADPNARTSDGSTPISLATSNGDTEMAELLLKFGAKPK